MSYEERKKFAADWLREVKKHLSPMEKSERLVAREIARYVVEGDKFSALSRFIWWVRWLPDNFPHRLLTDFFFYLYWTNEVSPICPVCGTTEGDWCKCGWCSSMTCPEHGKRISETLFLCNKCAKGRK